MDILGMMSKLNDLQAKMEASKKKLDSILIDAESGGVQVTVSASKNIRNIDIAAHLFDSCDKEQIEDLLIDVLNKAFAQADQISSNEMGAVSKDMLPPDLGNILG
ncbi:MAG: YbaB/EbfC family nucleoid-associated protein [Sphingobacteriales bacterium]|nr:YbaB/EbfC family nucleoid-associated protein [Sphingobacteriales bacterium]